MDVNSHVLIYTGHVNLTPSRYIIICKHVRDIEDLPIQKTMNSDLAAGPAQTSIIQLDIQDCTRDRASFTLGPHFARFTIGESL